MDALIRTGASTSVSGTSLVSLSFSSVSREQVILLLQVRANPRDAKTLEEEATTIIQHSLLTTEGDAWGRLDGALKELNGLLKGLLVSQTIDDVHAVLALLDKDGTLNVSHAGRAEAYLVHGGATSQITEYNRGKPVPMFVHISSGPLEPRDAVVFASQRVLRSMTPAQLAQAAQRGDQLLEEIIVKLDEDKEPAALAVLLTPAFGGRESDEAPALGTHALPSRRSARGRSASVAAPVLSSLASLKRFVSGFSIPSMPPRLSRAQGKAKAQRTAATMRTAVIGAGAWARWGRGQVLQILADLKNPERKRRAHLLILAGAIATFLIVWSVVRLTTFSQRSKTKAELAELVEQITAEVKTAENRHTAGDIEAANAILLRARQRAQEVMDNESGLYRMQALDLLDRIRAKQEEINNIVRLQPRVLVNLTTKNEDIAAQGLAGISDGEVVVYDTQNMYRVLQNHIDEPIRLGDEDLLTDGAYFSRFQSLVFLTSGNSVVEVAAGQITSMKTEDPSGWVKGRDMEAYLRFLYVLSPENNQIYKYERLTNRYGPAVSYNVNGNLSGALDMTIDGSIFVLREGGTIAKLFRGESQPFEIRRAPPDVLQNAERLVKVPDGSFYVLDPKGARVVVVSDGGQLGEAGYQKQYVLEGVGTLQDLYVDPDGTHLYLLDEKKVYVIDLAAA